MWATLLAYSRSMVGYAVFYDAQIQLTVQIRTILLIVLLPSVLLMCDLYHSCKYKNIAYSRSMVDCAGFYDAQIQHNLSSMLLVWLLYYCNKLCWMCVCPLKFSAKLTRCISSSPMTLQSFCNSSATANNKTHSFIVTSRWTRMVRYWACFGHMQASKASMRTSGTYWPKGHNTQDKHIQEVSWYVCGRLPSSTMHNIRILLAGWWDNGDFWVGIRFIQEMHGWGRYSCILTGTCGPVWRCIDMCQFLIDTDGLCSCVLICFRSRSSNAGSNSKGFPKHNT